MSIPLKQGDTHAHTHTHIQMHNFLAPTKYRRDTTLLGQFTMPAKSSPNPFFFLCVYVESRRHCTGSLRVDSLPHGGRGFFGFGTAVETWHRKDASKRALGEVRAHVVHFVYSMPCDGSKLCCVGRPSNIILCVPSAVPDLDVFSDQCFIF